MRYLCLNRSIAQIIIDLQQSDEVQSIWHAHESDFSCPHLQENPLFLDFSLAQCLPHKIRISASRLEKGVMCPRFIESCLHKNLSLKLVNECTFLYSQTSHGSSIQHTHR